MIDMAGVLTAHLRAQSGLMALVSNKVYAHELPQGTTAPYVLVRLLSSTPAAPPTLAYDSYAVQADCVGAVSDYDGATDICSAVRAALFDAPGVRSGARIASVQIGVASAGVDETSSPALPRWVLTVDVTGRSN